MSTLGRIRTNRRKARQRWDDEQEAYRRGYNAALERSARVAAKRGLLSLAGTLRTFKRPAPKFNAAQFDADNADEG